MFFIADRKYVDFLFRSFASFHSKVATILDSGEVGINAADESEITAIQVSIYEYMSTTMSMRADNTHREILKQVSYIYS